jgi:predicted glycoside hydrolase/deacetylase ChbG (UPF0249 family)
VRILIVNADDLGYDPEIDRGILEAHARGIVTSATAMVETPFAAAALRAAPMTLGIGLHAVLAPGASVAGIERALQDQLAAFEDLRGAAPTHLDSHKHLHASEAATPAFISVALERALPVRAIDPAMAARLRAAGVLVADHFLGDAALRPGWTTDRLVAAIERLGDGVSELMAHPGYRPSHARTSFGVEREAELEALCSDAARRAVASGRVRLCDYASAREPLVLGRVAAGSAAGK